MLRYEEIRWGIQECETEGCQNDAELIYDDRELLCVDCSDKRIERLQILGQYGADGIANLPPVGDWYEEVQPFRRWDRGEDGVLREVT